MADNNQMSDIHHSLGRIESKLESMDGRFKSGSEKYKEHDARLRKVENRQYWFTGIAAGAGALIMPALKKIGLM